MEKTNFTKGIGPDGFDGQVLSDATVRALVAKFLCDALNSGTIPQHIKDGRLVLLTKNTRQTVVPIEETRPIVINSHLYKVCEKAI